jgi:hypothetical protein
MSPDHPKQVENRSHPLDGAVPSRTLRFGFFLFDSSGSCLSVTRVKNCRSFTPVCPSGDFRPALAYNRPDQSAQSIRRNIDLRKIRRRNLLFAERAAYLSDVVGGGVPTRSSDGRGIHWATSPKPSRRALKTQSHHHEIRHSNSIIDPKVPVYLLRATIRTRSPLPRTVEPRPLPRVRPSCDF